MCRRSPTSAACSRQPLGRLATILSRADAAAAPSPNSVAGPGKPASSSAWASGSVMPVICVLKPSRNWKPPWRPRSPHSGTPAAESRRLVPTARSALHA